MSRLLLETHQIKPSRPQDVVALALLYSVNFFGDGNAVCCVGYHISSILVEETK